MPSKFSRCPGQRTNGPVRGSPLARSTPSSAWGVRVARQGRQEGLGPALAFSAALPLPPGQSGPPARPQRARTAPLLRGSPACYVTPALPNQKPQLRRRQSCKGRAWAGGSLGPAPGAPPPRDRGRGAAPGAMPGGKGKVPAATAGREEKGLGWAGECSLAAPQGRAVALPAAALPCTLAAGQPHLAAPLRGTRGWLVVLAAAGEQQSLPRCALAARSYPAPRRCLCWGPAALERGAGARALPAVLVCAVAQH